MYQSVLACAFCAQPNVLAACYDVTAPLDALDVPNVDSAIADRMQKQPLQLLQRQHSHHCSHKNDTAIVVIIVIQLRYSIVDGAAVVAIVAMHPPDNDAPTRDYVALRQALCMDERVMATLPMECMQQQQLPQPQQQQQH